MQGHPATALSAHAESFIVTLSEAKAGRALPVVLMLDTLRNVVGYWCIAHWIND